MLAAPRTDQPGVSRRLYLGPILALRALDVNVERVLALVRLNEQDLKALPERVEPDAMYDLWEAASRVHGTPGIGVRVAEHVRGEQFALYGTLLVSSATFADALARAVRLFRLVAETVRYSVRFDAESVEVTLERLPGSRVHSEAVEFMLGSMTSLARRLTGGAGNPLEIRFAHDAPPSLDHHRRFFRCPLRFGTTANAVSFDSAVLSLPAGGHDPERCRELERTAERRLSELRLAKGFSKDLIVAIHREIEGGEPTVERTAAVLGLHPKAMTRRLRSEGTSFSELLDDVRLRLACQYLNEPGARITEVAFRLGYSEKSAFNRAFKRWTGEAPERYRQRARPA